MQSFSVFGPAIDLSDYRRRRITSRMLRPVTDQFMQQIAAIRPGVEGQAAKSDPRR
jgi:hypothetical protein